MEHGVRIQIPVDEDEDNPLDLVAFFQERLESDLAPAIDYGVTEFDERATINNIECTDVVANDDSVIVTYEVSFSAYYGCSDMDYANTDKRTVRGRRVENTWVFPLHVPPPTRSTHDEL